MPPKVIVPRRGATLSQCLDNQYVPDDILGRLVRPGFSYAHPGVHEQRRTEVRRELIGSLLYSRQIIVNRAFFHNNDLLYGMYDGRNPDDQTAFRLLLEDEAVVPYLHAGEAELGGDMSFKTVEPGRRALGALLDVVGTNYAVVRLDDERARGMGTRFRDYFLHIGDVSEQSAAIIARDVLPAVTLGDASRKRFHHALQHVGAVAVRLHGEGRLQRETLYGELFGDGTDAIMRGDFRIKEPIGDQLGIVKKLIDLRYNTALPEVLGRYFASPSRFPTWAAMHDDAVVPAAPKVHDSSTSLATLAHLRLRGSADRQRRVDMVSLADVSLHDVVEIRRLEAWRAFIDAQDRLGSASARHLEEAVGEYFERYVAFHEHLALWLRKRRREARIERFLVWLDTTLTFAGVAALLIPDVDVREIAHPVVENLELVWREAPERFRVAQLDAVIEAFDERTNRRERDHARLFSVGAYRSREMRRELQALARELGGRPRPGAHYDGPGQSKGVAS